MVTDAGLTTSFLRESISLTLLMEVRLENKLSGISVDGSLNLLTYTDAMIFVQSHSSLISLSSIADFGGLPLSNRNLEMLVRYIAAESSVNARFLVLLTR